MGLQKIDVWFGRRRLGGVEMLAPLQWKGWVMALLCVGLFLALDFIGRRQHNTMFEIAAMIPAVALVWRIRQDLQQGSGNR